MNKTFAIGIPTLNRADLLVPALMYYMNDFPNTDFFIVDNGKQGLYEKLNGPGFQAVPLGRNRVVTQTNTNIGVAASWNFICRQIFKHYDHAIIMNDDIYWGRKEWEVEMFIKGNIDKHLITTPLDWCNFILSKKTFEEVGGFDEQFFPAYFEDNDYSYRMKLQGKSLYKVPFMLPQVHRVSQTMESGGLEMQYIKDGFRNNKKRYVEKWGGEPECETFKTPFNA
jgi:GT2 family glycosyltransferase